MTAGIPVFPGQTYVRKQVLKFIIVTIYGIWAIDCPNKWIVSEGKDNPMYCCSQKQSYLLAAFSL